MATWVNMAADEGCRSVALNSFSDEPDDMEELEFACYTKYQSGNYLVKSPVTIYLVRLPILSPSTCSLVEVGVPF